MLTIFQEWRNEILGKLNSEIINYLNQFERKALKGTHWSIPDPLMAALMIWPELITSKAKGYMVPNGTETDKSLVHVDWKAKNSNVEVVKDYDVTGFQLKLLKYLS